jgi:CCR4-NOT transcription complex subunit 9
MYLPPTDADAAVQPQLPAVLLANLSAPADTSTSSDAGSAGGSSGVSVLDRNRINEWILQLTNPTAREKALIELCKRKEMVHDLAPLLWHSFGTILALLQEILEIYQYIYPPMLTAHQSNRVCNTLALMQCVASHPETRPCFLEAQVPLVLYPLLYTTSKTIPFEYVRLTSLSVIGALVKADEQEVIEFLLSSKMIPLCLRIMESGCELTKTMATFILQKILLDNKGVAHACETYERFAKVAKTLRKMVFSLAKKPSAGLLKQVVKCYSGLAHNPQARKALSHCLPDQLRDNTFAQCLRNDRSTHHSLIQLLANLTTVVTPENPAVTIAPIPSSLAPASLSTLAAGLGGMGMMTTLMGSGFAVGGVNVAPQPSTSPVAAPLRLPLLASTGSIGCVGVTSGISSPTAVFVSNSSMMLHQGTLTGIRSESGGIARAVVSSMLVGSGDGGALMAGNSGVLGSAHGSVGSTGVGGGALRNQTFGVAGEGRSGVRMGPGAEATVGAGSGAGVVSQDQKQQHVLIGAGSGGASAVSLGRTGPSVDPAFGHHT